MPQNNGNTYQISRNEANVINPSYNNAVTQDPDSIVFPSQKPNAATTARDSYGNPVTPFTTLPDQPITIRTPINEMEVGHKTDVNKDQGVVLSGNNRPNSDGTLAFVLPSYASGITQVHAKPNLSGIPQAGNSNSGSLSSGNYNFPSNTKATTSPTTAYTQSAFTSTTNQQPQANYNRFGGEAQQTHQAPHTDLLPPLAPNSSPPPLGSRDSVSFSASNNQQTLLNKGSGQSQGAFIQSTAGQTYQGTTGTNGFVFATSQNVPQVQTNKPSTGNIFSNIPAYQGTGTNSNTGNQNKNSDRYSGSFGGAPGVLSPYDLGGIKPPPPKTTTTTTTVYTTQPTTTTNSYQHQQSFTNTQQSSVATGQIAFLGNTQTTQSLNSGNNPFFGQQQNAITGQTSTTSGFNNHFHAPAVEHTTANYGHNPFLSGGNQNTRPQQDVHNHQHHHHQNQNTQTTASVQQPTQQIIVGNNNKENRYSGSFGGPPGVLQPYDTIDKRFGQ